jgi:DNA topoisomerase-1
MNAYAGESRHILDWYYGINLSRALMGAIRKNNVYKVMSIGRVQGPALAILARRERKIKEFKPEPYWDLWAKAKNLIFMHVKNKFEKEDEMKKALENSKSPVKVSKMIRKEFKEKPYPPFDLTSLQVEAYKIFKFQPSQVLQMSQTLYEASMISYPRTSSQKLPDSLDHKGIIEKLSKLPKYKEVIKKAVTKTKPFEGTKSDPAHPAIHPLGTLSQIGTNEMKLYDLIVRRYLSCFGEDALRENQEIRIETNKEEYKINGRRTIEKGWFEIYEPYLRLQELTLPEFKKGEEFDAKFGSDKKETKPPNRYTPSSIVSTLEKKNLGTKATRSTIIETLYKRGYVDGKSIEVTPFGMSVYEVLTKNCDEILDEKLTEHFESEMEKIQEGKIAEYSVIEEGKETLIKILDKFKEKEDTIGKSLAENFKISNQNVIGKCPSCDEDLIAIKSNSTGKQFVGCKNYPKCNVSYPLPQNSLIEATNKICEKCHTPIVKVIRKGKKPFEMCLDVNCETKKDWGKYKKPIAKKTVSNSTIAKKTVSKTISKKQKK